ncbi:hypothetical protein M408DRAFT_326241 [Serendipita vermifera MAFF 305830]|uniref:Elongation factor 1 alpha-like protein n=1 Tax=Serendipita vermifera MAFF 305830 TaxID=933852 RepID=A0A0C3BQ09_SERVB|nr:hypothetical protein M408DRAFT_326241 [Serendipita vermifera MAFF 305830]
MSRHRFVRNLALTNPQDDFEALSDGGEDENNEITPEQLAQMNSVREHIRAVIGPPKRSGISDKEIDDASWEYYFDLDQTMDHILEIQGRRNAAKERQAAKEREKQEKMAAMTGNARVGALRAGAPTKTSPKKSGKASGAATPVAAKMDQMDADMLALGLQDSTPLVMDTEEPPKISLAREKLLEEAKRAISGQGGDKLSLSIVIIGHVDAGKSTLVGRLMYDLGSIDQRKRAQTERSSEKMGKASFSWAWEMDSGVEERNRGITIDMAQSVLSLPNRTIVVLDAPGHKDFVPNMISGASQADTALLVVDATNGEFEAGFDKGGQTREHLLLVRSLGVQQLIVAVNKLDTVAWSEDRYNEIKESLGNFLVQSGFQQSKTSFVPVAGFLGVNLVDRLQPEATELEKWYTGPTLVETLDKLDPPGRAIEAPFRFPITNLFKGQNAASSGVAVSGKLVSGVVQVGERVRVVPGDESAVIKLIMADGESLPWAAAGSNVDIYLSNIDPIHLTIGSVLCPTSAVVPLVASFIAQVIIFDQSYPITVGASAELFHQSQNIPVTIVPLETLDRITGATIKSNPRVLSKGMSAKIRVAVRGSTISESSASASHARLPIETFKDNKDMGRILLRRNGETIAAGIILSLE